MSRSTWNYRPKEAKERTTKPRSWFDRLPPRFQFWSVTVDESRYRLLVEHRHGTPGMVDTVWGPVEAVALQLLGEPIQRVVSLTRWGMRNR